MSAVDYFWRGKHGDDNDRIKADKATNVIALRAQRINGTVHCGLLHMRAKQELSFPYICAVSASVFSSGSNLRADNPHHF